MLRSEHIPWNVFVPMMHEPCATAHLFNDILGTDEIDEVTDIRIEWAPDKTKCLNDNTSFDTYIEYLHDGKTCGIGIEVKYTEEGYPFGVKERREVMENERSKDALVTKSSNWYIPEIANLPIRETPLCKDKYRQIWRNISLELVWYKTTCWPSSTALRSILKVIRILAKSSPYMSHF